MLSSNEESKEKSNVEGAVFQNSCSTCSSSSKYCCPGCSNYSCSAECVKAHKITTGCNGIRDKTSFVAAEQFKEGNLLSDYHFLEEINRTISNANRSKKTHGFNVYSRFLPRNLHRLKVAAKSRKTDLQILPVMFSKRKTNTSYLRYSDRKIFWRIDWSFPQIEMSCFDERIDEEKLLGYCLDKYLLPDPEIDQHPNISYYQSMGHSGVTVLLKKEDTTANDIKYYELNQKKSLKRNFEGKRIIEYPSLLVVPKIHLGCYPLAESGDAEEDIKHGS